MTVPFQRHARAGFLGSLVVITSGAVLAARQFPSDFDWRYQVVSALASHKHNPEGAIWFASALALAMLLLWPVTTHLRDRAPPRPRRVGWFVAALRVGLISGMAVGVERAVFHHFSDIVRKGHEVLALLSFLALFAGVIGLYARHLRRRSAWFWPAVAVLVPVIGIGCSELLLYLDQREVGWADYDWRETGLPVWLSFAFWQWLAMATLWLSLGGLAWIPPAGSAPTNSGPA